MTEIGLAITWLAISVASVKLLTVLARESLTGGDAHRPTLASERQLEEDVLPVARPLRSIKPSDLSCDWR